MATFFKRFLFEEDDNPKVRTRTRANTTGSVKKKKDKPLPLATKPSVTPEKEKKEKESLPDTSIGTSIGTGVGTSVGTMDDTKIKTPSEDVKVISITKAKKKQSGWNEHVAKYKKEHPELSGSELFKQAKKHYNQQLKNKK